VPAMSFSVRTLRLVLICVASLSVSALASTTSLIAATIELPKSSPFPESVASAPDGTLYASSISNGGVVRIRAGSAPEIFIKPGAYGTRSTFGVHVDPHSAILWVCSNDASKLGIKGPNDIQGSYLKGFDLETGEDRLSYQLPGSAVICNDTAFGSDGSIYVTNTVAPQILKLAPGAKALAIWLSNDALKGGLDGIAFGEDGNLYVNTYVAGELFRIDVKDGAPGQVTKLTTSRALTHPDALRSVKGGFLMVEGAGRLDHITVSGDKAMIDTVKPFAGPTGVEIVGDTVWVAEGQLDHLADLAKGIPLPSFQLRSIPLAEALAK
jgi:streptogramin lyase